MLLAVHIVLVENIILSDVDSILVKDIMLSVLDSIQIYTAMRGSG